MILKTFSLVSLLCLGFFQAAHAGTPEEGFAKPPEETKPWCYWYWISDNLSKEGITRDLEAMARVGIGEALIGNIFLEDVPAGKIKVLTPEWWELVEHAIREGGRTRVNIGMFNCPGWSQSGGPWIKPTETMRYLAASEERVTGPRKFAAKLVEPKPEFQDVAVLAFPVPQSDSDSIAARVPRVTCVPAAKGVEKLLDGSLATDFEFPTGAGRGNSRLTIDFETTAPFTARSLQIFPTESAFGAQCELRAVDEGGVEQSVRRFKCDRSNMAIGVGFMPRGPVVVSFPSVTAKKFQLVFTELSGGEKPALAEIELSGAARLEAFIEKQLGKMHPTPLPMWDTYLWPTQREPDDARLVVPPGKVQDLTRQLAADGTLVWDVPDGDWIVQRIGMTPTGMKNSPASPEGQGLEVDKMNRALAKRHFDEFIGEVLRRVPASDRKAFKQVIADSYEMGSQNWTDGFDSQFQKRWGYDPKPWLPVLSGRLVGSADQSERFLWDLRRLVADRIATDYVGGLRDASRPHGLGLWLENYGHWGFPGEFLKYGGESDRVSGEYWVTGDLGSIELRAASSCANTYGKRFVSAEAFTGGPAFQNAPAALKARGDWSFCEGVNHFVLHVYIHQPWEERLPGVNAWFGTEFNRHNTWFEQSKTWIEYVRRCCWLLQQGNRVVDVAYFIGEDAPKMTGVCKPELPAGRDFDYINAEVIETKLAVRNGVLSLPHGTSYRVLVLPELATMRPKVLSKISQLVKAGATVLGPPPSRSPSMENYPKCDEEVKGLAAELWGTAETTGPGERKVGKGRVVWGKPLDSVLSRMDSPADFQSSVPLRFTHRRSGDTDIYFVANPKAEPLTTTVVFRVKKKAPEFWWPDSGRIERAAVYDCVGDSARVPVSFGQHGSVFVVFRDKAAPASERIVSVVRNGEEILGTKVASSEVSSNRESPNTFAFSVWCKPADGTTLARETNRGVVGLSEKRNDALTPPHGDGFGGSGHAGVGLALGTNGVCVFEHGANYFAPTLVHTGAISGWTHVAVVYRDAKPHLYLNGVLVRSGLKSEHIVHSGASAGGNSQFRGKLGSFEQFSRNLSEQELTSLPRTMPMPGMMTGPAVNVVKDGRKLVVSASQAGEYELVSANGGRRKLTFGTGTRSQPIEGRWEVGFSPGWGAPERIIFNSLGDWTERPEAGIRHYSGKAIYRKTVELSKLEPGVHLLLDLGEVRDLATVRWNGREVGTLWLAPWQLDITHVARPGANTLEVEVVNVWNNRLAADAALPADLRRTFLLAPTVKASTPLLPAGLLGPVQLLQVVSREARDEPR